MPYKDKKDKKEYNKRYYIDHRKELLEQHKQWAKNKSKTDFRFNLNHRMRRDITKSLKGNKKGRNWETLVDYTLKDLIKRLKKTMPEGYTWNDYLDGKLHIDHKIPISVFNFTKPEHTDFKRCWALENLRLLPAKENLGKSNKLEKPFQPTLRI